jgi:hypothetical protein
VKVCEYSGFQVRQSDTMISLQTTAQSLGVLLKPARDLDRLPLLTWSKRLSPYGQSDQASVGPEWPLDKAQQNTCVLNG